MYRLKDAIRVKRATAVYWTLTFEPRLPRSGPELDTRHLIVTVLESRYEAMKDHGPNFTREEIDAMGNAAPLRQRKA